MATTKRVKYTPISPSKIKDGKRVGYHSRKIDGEGRVVESYKRKTGMWVIVHDKARNASVTVRQSQISELANG